VERKQTYTFSVEGGNHISVRLLRLVYTSTIFIYTRDDGPNNTFEKRALSGKQYPTPSYRNYVRTRYAKRIGPTFSRSVSARNWADRSSSRWLYNARTDESTLGTQITYRGSSQTRVAYAVFETKTTSSFVVFRSACRRYERKERPHFRNENVLLFRVDTPLRLNTEQRQRRYSRPSCY